MRVSSPGRWILVFTSTLILAGCSTSPSMLSPNGPDASRTAGLSLAMFITAGIVVIVVTVLLLYGLLHRRRGEEISLNDRKKIPLILFGGAVVPVVVLFAFMATSIALQNGIPVTGGSSALVVEVIGHEWWWEVRYPQYGFTTANEIHIPAGQPVTLHLTSADVIHSFWVPQLHGKLDTIPGQTNTMMLQADHPGVYRGQCAEYCGEQHAHMAFLVFADSANKFQDWVKQNQKPAPSPATDSMAEQGQQVFLGSACVYCHTIRGTNAYGTLGPDLTHLASRTTLGAGAIPNTPGNLGGWIINAQNIKPGNKMPPMDLSSTELQEVLAYLATLK